MIEPPHRAPTAEVAYYFVALVMGLVKGMDVADRRLVLALNLLLLVVMAVFDSKPLREWSRRLDVQLKKVHENGAALVADLERQLGGRMMCHEVTEVDLGRQHTTVDVRYRPGIDATTATESVEPGLLDATTATESVEPGQLAAASAVEETHAGPEAGTTPLVSIGARDSGEARSDRVE